MKIILNANTDLTPENSLKLDAYSNYFLNILTNLGYDPNNLPLADVLKTLHGLTGQWLVVSPVNWLATHNDSMLVAAGEDLALDSATSNLLFDNFANFVRDEGIKACMHSPYIWLINVDDKPIINAKPVYSLLNRSIMPELETLDKNLYWQKLITEIQMLFSGLQLDKGLTRFPVNGIWVWGAGKYTINNLQRIVALDAEAQTLANVLATQTLLYDNSITMHNDDILLGSSKSSLQNLSQVTLSKIKYWYWNNQAYKLKSVNLLQKILRSIHAYTTKKASE